MSKKPLLLLGWSAGKTWSGDYSGRYHAVVARDGELVTRAACGSRVMLAGQVEKAPPSFSHPCRACTKAKAVREAEQSGGGES